MVDQNIITVLVVAAALYGAVKVTRLYDKWKYEQNLHTDATYRAIEEGDRALALQLEKTEEHLHRRIDELTAENQNRSCGCAKRS
jgi:hypothetical protein